MNWFRFYSDALTDPKVQRLPDKLFKVWVNLLCLASKDDGILPDASDIAFVLHLKEAETRKFLAELCSRRLLDEIDGGYTPHNWSTRQKASDNVTARVQAFRERQKAQQDAEISDDVTIHETAAPEYETFHETPAKRSRNGPIREIDRKRERETRETRAHPLPPDFAVTPQMLLWARNRAPDVDHDLQTERFVNYWRGNDQRKIDWEATWRNWMLGEQDKVKRAPTYRTQADLNSARYLAASGRIST